MDISGSRKLHDEVQPKCDGVSFACRYVSSASHTEPGEMRVTPREWRSATTTGIGKSFSATLHRKQVRINGSSSIYESEHHGEILSRLPFASEWRKQRKPECQVQTQRSRPLFNWSGPERNGYSWDLSQNTVYGPSEYWSGYLEL